MTMSAAPATLSLEQKLGQMVMFDFTGTRLDESVRARMEEHAFGGFILFAKNVRDREQVRQLCCEVHEVGVRASGGIPPFIGIDQEGGSVVRLAFPDTPMSPGNMATAATGRLEWAREAARYIAADLRDLGINLNFAPSVDVNNNPANPIIGVRSFGEDPQVVARFGVEAARGFREGGVVPCAKHFPGHGDTSMDSHLALPVIPHAMERLQDVELPPFRAVIDDGIEMIMTAHIVFTGIPGVEARPATLSSRVLTDLLRDEMGFKGVVITDSMAMEAVSRTFGTGPAAVMAVNAGADIVLACGTPEQQAETMDALRDAVERGEIPQARIDASVARILALKRSLPPPVPLPPPAVVAERMLAIARESIALVRDGTSLVPLTSRGIRRLLLVGPSHVSRSPHGELAVPFSLGSLLSGHGFEVTERLFSPVEGPPAVSELAGTAEGAEAILVCLHSRHRLDEAVVDMAGGLARLGRPVVALAINSPYVASDVPWIPTCLCSFGYTEVSMRALADVLAGVVEPRGRLPVTLP